MFDSIFAFCGRTEDDFRLNQRIGTSLLARPVFLHTYCKISIDAILFKALIYNNEN